MKGVKATKSADEKLVRKWIYQLINVIFVGLRKRLSTAIAKRFDFVMSTVSSSRLKFHEYNSLTNIIDFNRKKTYATFLDASIFATYFYQNGNFIK